ncbi:MAG: hypothetical protein IJD52_04115 [Alphaproteobacteria bacterium]|nr:hypothetical protein [Alphaproteobacteria bacterium]
MDKDEIVVTDPNFRPDTSERDAEYKKYEAEKLAEAERRENERLERAVARADAREKKIKAFFRGVKALFSRNAAGNDKER